MNRILKRIAFTDDILDYDFSTNDFEFRECLVYNKSYMFNLINKTKFDSKELSKIVKNAYNPVTEQLRENILNVFHEIAKQYVQQNTERFGTVDNLDEFVANFKYIIT